VTWFTGLVVYILIWWTALFTVLPVGTHPESEADPATGGWRGTPQKHHLGWKVLATTVLSALLWLGVYAVVESGWISFRSGWLAMPAS